MLYLNVPYSIRRLKGSIQGYKYITTLSYCGINFTFFLLSLRISHRNKFQWDVSTLFYCDFFFSSVQVNSTHSIIPNEAPFLCDTSTSLFIERSFSRYSSIHWRDRFLSITCGFVTVIVTQNCNGERKQCTTFSRPFVCYITVIDVSSRCRKRKNEVSLISFHFTLFSKKCS